MPNHQRLEPLNLSEDRKNAELTTVALMGNPQGRAKLESILISQSEKSRKKDKAAKELRQDVKFYRKRISQACRDLLLYKPEEYISAKTRVAFDEFLRNVVEDFRITDTTDLIQSQHISPTCDAEDDSNQTVAQPSAPTTSPDSAPQLKVISQANAALYKPKNVSATLDNYVIKQKHEGIPDKNKMNEVARTDGIDLRAPTLRTKGIATKNASTGK
jgi:hypothetical protein